MAEGASPITMVLVAGPCLPCVSKKAVDENDTTAIRKDRCFELTPPLGSHPYAVFGDRCEMPLILISLTDGALS